MTVPMKSLVAHVLDRYRPKTARDPHPLDRPTRSSTARQAELLQETFRAIEAARSGANPK
jgi:hypothetical protein